MKIEKKLISTSLGLLICTAATNLKGAGVTVITHGLDGNADGWVRGMAEQIPHYTTFPGSGFTLYKFYFNPNGGGSYSLAWSRLAGNQPSSVDSGEIIVVLDWNQLSDGNSFSTYDIAQALSAALQSTSFISELQGHALCEFPIHLIGHSRGGSLMSEVTKRLGTNGIWVDHLTTLDPHPLNNDGFDLDAFLYSVTDAPVRTYGNVLFHDNYWQDLALAVYGEPVDGAYVRQLYNLSGGYQNIGDLHYPHSNVHLWYHGTVDERYPADDSESQLTGSEFANWYNSYERIDHNAGFVWSQIGGGDRTTFDRPEGPGYPAIRDGYNQTWDLGAGQSVNRTLLPSNNGSWPNIVRMDVVGATMLTSGTTGVVKYFYQFGSSSNQSATVQVYLDDDTNPYNGNRGEVLNQAETGTGTNFIRWRIAPFNVPLVPPGQYYVCGKVTGGSHTRYVQATERITVLPPPDTTASALSILFPAAGQRWSNSVITVSGTASDDIAVSNVWVQVNGEAWQVATGTTNWTMDANLVPGTNTVRAYAVDTSGNSSAVQNRQFVYVQSTVLVVQVAGDGTVTPNYNGQFLELGRTFAMTATANPGSVFSNWMDGTGLVLTNGATLRFFMQSNLVFRANFIPNPFIPASGSYAGLFYDTNSGVTVSNAGFFTAKVTSRGSFTAKVLLGPKNYPLSGKFAIDGSCEMPKIKGAPGLTAFLQLGVHEITGNISASNWSAEITANRAVYSSANPLPEAGHYTLVFPGSESDSLPSGNGVAAINLSSAGGVTVSGILGDGVKFAEKTFVSQERQWPLYSTLYSKKGILIGWLTLTNEAELMSDVNGVVAWIKPSQTGTKIYPNGFDWPYDSETNNVFGSAFTNRNPLLTWTNGIMDLQYGNLAQPITNMLALNGSKGSGTNDLKLKVITSGNKSGLFKGSILNAATGKAIRINGVLLQKKDSGFGVFLGTNQSGKVFLGHIDE